MSLTLAIDTSTDVRVGLAADGAVLASSAVTDPRAHAEQLMPLIERTLAELDPTQFLRVDGADPAELVGAVIVLSLPGAIGAAAARVIL